MNAVQNTLREPKWMGGAVDSFPPHITQCGQFCCPLKWSEKEGKVLALSGYEPPRSVTWRDNRRSHRRTPFTNHPRPPQQGQVNPPESTVLPLNARQNKKRGEKKHSLPNGVQRERHVSSVGPALEDNVITASNLQLQIYCIEKGPPPSPPVERMASN